MSSSGVSTVNVRVVDVVLADCADLDASPVELMAAPGAARAIYVESVCVSTVPDVGAIALSAPCVSYTDNTAANRITNASMISLPLAFGLSLDNAIGVGNGTDKHASFTATIAENAPIMLTDAGPASDERSAIATTVLDGAGTGYVVGDTGTLDGGFAGHLATYRILTVDVGTGAVLTYAITAAGDGYQGVGTTANTTTGGAQPGVGIDFTIDVSTIAPITSALRFTIMYRVLSFT